MSSKNKWRDKNPLKYAYDTLKHNCYRKHGIGWFELSFEEFSLFAIQSEYITKKGIKKTSYHVDRIDSSMGYFIGNIRAVPAVVNGLRVHKQLVYFWSEESRQMIFKVDTHKTETEFLF